MSIKQSHSFSLGIVGLPNVGKSTIFNVLTKMSVPAENFPFCTIDKNIGVVQVPDERLEKLAKHFNTEKIVPSMMKFVDIAGLVKGASKGEGLGNQFLSHIREVDVIMYILRAFESEKITHVYDRIDPLADYEIVQSELILKDIESVEKRIGSSEKMKRIGDEKASAEVKLLKRVLGELNEGIPVIDMKLNNEEKEILAELSLLTNKKRFFILNSRADIDKEKIANWKKGLEDETGDKVLIVDIKLLSEMAEMEEGEVQGYMEMFDEKPKTVEDIIEGAFEVLNLITFYTGSEKECNAWSIVKGSTVKEAAGVIHTDLEKGFITADVVNLEKMLEVGGWLEAKEKGLVKNHGKEYVVEDGDYIIILANTK
ncbi:MAG: GTP-binding protein YchF [candidate division WS6 bacterium 36_33]|uniref:GTP-binding protein YchF n=1 Tax=candidate division WS6 bacterium 36_33 TaxID=1641388 RepID=A0A117LU58_9BACT|nr:MAG: GTP-binding protein YchF [candidate division WS6 bacterium 36_33]